MKMSIFRLEDKKLVKAMTSWLVDHEVTFDFCPDEDMFELRIDKEQEALFESAFKGQMLRFERVIV